MKEQDCRLRKTEALKENEIDQRDVTVLDGEPPLGKGSFGEVFKCKYAGQLCAIKYIYTASTYQENVKIYESFEREFALIRTRVCAQVLDQHVPARGASVRHHHQHDWEISDGHGVCRGRELAPLFDEACIDAVGKEHGAQLGVRHCVWNESIVRHGRPPPGFEGIERAVGRILSCKSVRFRSLESVDAAKRERECLQGQGALAWESPEELGDCDDSSDSDAPGQSMQRVALDDEKCDVYSFAITVWEIMTRKLPWDGKSPKGIQKRVVLNEKRPKYDPGTFEPMYGKKLLAVMENGWAQSSKDRPTFSGIVADIASFERAGAGMVRRRSEEELAETQQKVRELEEQLHQMETDKKKREDELRQHEDELRKKIRREVEAEAKEAAQAEAQRKAEEAAQDEAQRPSGRWLIITMHSALSLPRKVASMLSWLP